MVVGTVVDGELRIRSTKAVITEIQDRLAPYFKHGDGGSEALIRERREEAALEEREYRESPRVRRPGRIGGSGP
jgi:hypothetical protein